MHVQPAREDFPSSLPERPRPSLRVVRDERPTLPPTPLEQAVLDYVERGSVPKR